MFLVFRESRAVFAFDRACDLAALVLHVVVNEDVAFFGEDGHRLVLRQIAGGRPRLPRLFFRKFSPGAALAVDAAKGRLFPSGPARPPPAGIKPPATPRPVD